MPANLQVACHVAKQFKDFIIYITKLMFFQLFLQLCRLREKHKILQYHLNKAKYSGLRRFHTDCGYKNYIISNYYFLIFFLQYNVCIIELKILLISSQLCNATNCKCFDKIKQYNKNKMSLFFTLIIDCIIKIKKTTQAIVISLHIKITMA